MPPGNEIKKIKIRNCFAILKTELALVNSFFNSPGDSKDKDFLKTFKTISLRLQTICWKKEGPFDLKNPRVSASSLEEQTFSFPRFPLSSLILLFPAPHQLSGAWLEPSNGPCIVCVRERLDNPTHLVSLQTLGANGLKSPPWSSSASAAAPPLQPS
jgi:hypothetical protein